MWKYKTIHNISAFLHTIKLRDGLLYLISIKIPAVRLSLNISSELCEPATVCQEHKT